MANDIDLDRVQTVLGYQFRNTQLLTEALTAADRVEYEDGTFESYENNRRAAALGEAVIQLVLADNWYPNDEPRSELENIEVQQASNQTLSVIAIQTGIDSCIVRSDRQRTLTSLPQATLSTAVRAVVGAVWLDSNKDLANARQVLQQLR